MSTDQLSNRAPDITAEACAWLAQLETGALTAADLDAFHEWIRRSPPHAAEIKRLALMSKQLNVLTDMAEPLRTAAEQRRLFPSRRHKPSVLMLSHMVKATIAVACMVAAILSVFPIHAPSHIQLISTMVGEYRDIDLPDGTRIRLSTASQIEVNYQTQMRKVRLLAGEAFFDVTPDSERPFLVYANDKYVRAIGTAFLVRLIDKDIEVMVTEGRVELAETATVTGKKHSKAKNDVALSNDNTASAPIALKAGQRILVSTSHSLNPVITLSSRDQKRELSWQEGLHDFSDTPLDKVVAELSRHSGMDIVMSDPELRKLRFSGIFRIGETKPLFDALEESFGIDVTRAGGNRIILSLAKRRGNE